MIIQTSKELFELTGSFDAGVSFDGIRSDIEIETDTVIGMIGQELYDLALAEYTNREVEPPSVLVQLAQRPIALLATLRYQQGNIVNHSGNRVVGVDGDSEKIPWEWMLAADDDAKLRKAYKAIDMLLKYAEKQEIKQWVNSPIRRQLNGLMVRSIEDFEKFYFIDHSHRFFYILAPLIREIQNRELNVSIDNLSCDQLCAAQGAVVLRTMAMALRRFSLKIFPDGVVTQFDSPSQNKRATQPATQMAIDIAVADLNKQADSYLFEFTRLCQGDNVEQINLLPINSVDQKFFSC